MPARSPSASSSAWPSASPVSSTVWCAPVSRSPSTRTSRSSRPWRATASSRWSKKPTPVCASASAAAVECRALSWTSVSSGGPVDLRAAAHARRSMDSACTGKPSARASAAPAGARRARRLAGQGYASHAAPEVPATERDWQRAAPPVGSTWLAPAVVPHAPGARRRRTRAARRTAGHARPRRRPSRCSGASALTTRGATELASRTSAARRRPRGGARARAARRRRPPPSSSSASVDTHHRLVRAVLGLGEQVQRDQLGSAPARRPPRPSRSARPQSIATCRTPALGLGDVGSPGRRSCRPPARLGPVGEGRDRLGPADRGRPR